MKINLETGKKDDVVSFKRADLIKEHKKLVKVLRKGSRHQLIMEANDQERELNEYLKGGI